MNYSFSPSEILKIAAENEVAGEVFYAGLASVSPTEEVRKMLTYLSEQEKNHEASFLAMAHELEGLESGQEYALDLLGEMKKAIHAMQQQAFTTANGNLDTTSLKKALEIGIRTETVSISVYTAMEGSFIEKFKPILNSIIAAEHSHLSHLESLLSALEPTP